VPTSVSHCLTACRVCGGPNLELAIDLGTQPWANDFLTPDKAGSEAYYPLRVLHCADCETAQLDYTVRKEVLFGDHTYLSGVTRTLREHFEHTAATVDKAYFAGRTTKSVLDIGSNDGTQLAAFKALGYDVLGVESSRSTARFANERGISTLNVFFNETVANQLARRFDVINAAGVFFHLEELHSVTEGVRLALADDGVFVVQALYMRNIVRNLAFDQIYHEHLLYYTASTLSRLLARHGLEIFDVQVSPIHGGSLIAHVGHAGRRAPVARVAALLAQEAREQVNALATYRTFAKAIAARRDDERARLGREVARGKRIYGFGAPVKGNTLLNYFGFGPDTIVCLVEKNPLRRGLVSPGMHIPVVLESDVTTPPDIYYVLAWNFRDEILANNHELIDRGVDFQFPVEPIAA
jgi:SAM-dependent methyltransferase